MTNPADYLSDEDAERMDRIRAPARWRMYDHGHISNKPKWFAARMEQMRRAWAVRPESARRLDESIGPYLRSDEYYEGDHLVKRALAHAVYLRDRELLKAPTGGAA